MIDPPAARSATIDVSLAPGFLVAAPGMPDPRFAHSVVLMARDDEDGALGFIINRSTVIDLATVLEQVDGGWVEEAERRGLAEQLLLLGGPVMPEAVWIMVDDEDLADEDWTISIDRGLVVANSPELLGELVSGERPGPFHVLLGYAGWAPEQLHDEVAHGGWLPLSLDRSLIFEVPMEDRWKKALEQLGLTPGGFIVGGSGAMA